MCDLSATVRSQIRSVSRRAMRTSVTSRLSFNSFTISVATPPNETHDTRHTTRTTTENVWRTVSVGFAGEDVCGVLEALVIEVLHDELKNLALVQKHVLAHDHRPFRLRPLLACPPNK